MYYLKLETNKIEELKKVNDIIKKEVGTAKITLSCDSKFEFGQMVLNNLD